MEVEFIDINKQKEITNIIQKLMAAHVIVDNRYL